MQFVAILFVLIVFFGLKSCILDDDPLEEMTPVKTSYSSPSYEGDAELREQAAGLIRSKGYWCGRAASINPTLFGQSANHKTYRVFCDDGSEVASYEMEIGRNGSYLIVREM